MSLLHKSNIPVRIPCVNCTCSLSMHAYYHRVLCEMCGCYVWKSCASDWSMRIVDPPLYIRAPPASPPHRPSFLCTNSHSSKASNSKEQRRVKLRIILYACSNSPETYTFHSSQNHSCILFLFYFSRYGKIFNGRYQGGSRRGESFNFTKYIVLILL